MESKITVIVDTLAVMMESLSENAISSEVRDAKIFFGSIMKNMDTIARNSNRVKKTAIEIEIPLKTFF